MATSTNPSPIVRAAQEYLARGYTPIPIPSKEKGPKLRGWQNLRPKLDELPRYFSDGANIGLLVGEPSHGLVDVDLDCDEATALARSFLPDPKGWSGRASRPRSHAWYQCVPAPASRQFEDADGTMLVEIRSTGQQTLVRPSVHPDGDQYQWYGDFEPANIEASALLRHVSCLASAALLTRHWPCEKGSRHNIANALAGFLVRGGFTADATVTLIEAVATAAGDEQARDRARAARATAAKVAANRPVTGGPTLAELLGEQVVDKIRTWLELRRTTAPDDGEPVLVTLSSVTPRPIEWLWPGRWPRGKLTIIGGDPGIGKSSLLYDAAARCSTGTPWPDGHAAPCGDVIILTAEDGLDDTVAPRVKAPGGNLDRVHVLEAIRQKDKQRPVSLATDLGHLEAVIRAVKPVLVIIDPLSAYVGAKTDTHRDSEVRSVLAPVAHLAEETNVALVVVMHLAKAQLPKALYQIGGSIGFVAAARSVFVVAIDPDDSDPRSPGAFRFLAPLKLNIASPPPTLAFHIQEDPEMKTTRIVWVPDPISGMDAERLMRARNDDADEKRSLTAQAVEFLEQEMQLALQPIARLAKAVRDEAQAHGLSARVLERARERLGIKAIKEQKKGGGRGDLRWWWLPPGMEQPPDEPWPGDEPDSSSE